MANRFGTIPQVEASLGKRGSNFSINVGRNDGNNTGHNLLQSPAALLHRGGKTISEDEMVRIVIQKLVDIPYSLGVGMLNPLIASFPEPFVVPLDALPELAPALELLFSEATSELPGRQAALDRLFEYVLVLLIRSALNARLVDSGVLWGLADERLGKAIEGMHKHPETDLCTQGADGSEPAVGYCWLREGKTTDAD